MTRGGDLGKGLSAFQRGDFITARLESTPLAEQGNAVAQINLGLIYNKGNGVLRDANLSNPNDEILVLDVASASVGSVVGLDAYSYLYTTYGLSVNDIRQLCAYLSQAKNQSREVKIVTRSATWGYMTASESSLYDLKIKDVKLVGPHVTESKTCEG